MSEHEIDVASGGGGGVGEGVGPVGATGPIVDGARKSSRARVAVEELPFCGSEAIDRETGLRRKQRSWLVSRPARLTSEGDTEVTP